MCSNARENTKVLLLCLSLCSSRCCYGGAPVRIKQRHENSAFPMNTKVLFIKKKQHFLGQMDGSEIYSYVDAKRQSCFSETYIWPHLIRTKMKPFWLKHKHWDAICPTQPYPIAAWELVLDSVFNKYACYGFTA